jgi:hypothetical protein
VKTFFLDIKYTMTPIFNFLRGNLGLWMSRFFFTFLLNLQEIIIPDPTVWRCMLFPQNTWDEAEVEGWQEEKVKM